jgi:hypothetical protein
MWFSTGGERVRQTLEDAFAWCDQCGVVSDAPSADEHGDAFWVQIGLHAQQVRAAILSNLESGDPELLRALHGSGCVRRFVDGTRARGHFVWFERGDELRLLLAPGALRASTVAGPGLWLYWGGPSSGMADGLKAAFEECWSSSIPVSPADSVGGLPPASTVTPYSRPIPGVREVLGIRSTPSFLDLDTEAQERALWSTLIGEGAVDLEQAVRSCAERLRAQGFLEYRALRQDGRVHGVIEAACKAADEGQALSVSDEQAGLLQTP